MIINKRLGISTLFLIICIIGCASPPNPIDKISNVEMRINQAREGDANEYAPLELKLASDKLIEAKVLYETKNYEQARYKANEALVDVELAEAKTRSEKTKKLAKEMQDSINVFRQEIDRTFMNKKLNEENLLME